MAKIIIAEDDRVSGMILKKAVESIGHIAILCSDGLRTTHVLEDNTDFEMLITDMVMPNLDGRKLVEYVRNNDKIKDIPIMVISGIVGPKAIRDLLELGATEFLGKPVDSKKLQDFIQKSLEK